MEIECFPLMLRQPIQDISKFIQQQKAHNP
ncbi:hypothetical protein PPL_06415 [Heterostelium album PN500]|uniref:Uncharacterized protein n=1 Tax=Heterostelium pallidum (strain ATCC 26659 / Pp 5 / PN500) TaxID=670386 RepID=D3BD35_HETP5|nr:hypothetical protein PPL_06415 [Heterostelium album PN500]EFA80827.1 hypothetical protein PPL_06415 [Heterostelium album PN500]|eukprot:XP_020432946.1 hypothetical protein PPL_06415 [Heterostelium album PN500]